VYSFLLEKLTKKFDNLKFYHKMAHKKMVYKKDYIDQKLPIRFLGKSTKCSGSKLMIDGCGYYSKSCEKIIKKANLIFLFLSPLIFGLD